MAPLTGDGLRVGPAVRPDAGAAWGFDQPAGVSIQIEVETPDGPHTLLRRAARAAARTFDLPPPRSLIGLQPARVAVVALEGAGDRLATQSFEYAVHPSEFEPAMVTAYLNRGGAGNPVVRAFADAINCDLRYADEEMRSRPGVSVVWGVLRGSDRVVQLAKAAGRHFFYIDHAYFGRGHHLNYRITRNAYEAGPVRECPPDRAEALGVRLAPWRSGGSSILVCPPTQYFMDAHGCPNWLQDTIRAIRRATDRPIEIRDKPQSGEPSEPLASALNRTYALVTHSSNVAVEAVVAGVPVFVAPTSAAAPVGATDLSRIEQPLRPDREPWLAHMAYCQFASQEIATGTAWRLLLEYERRPFL